MLYELGETTRKKSNVNPDSVAPPTPPLFLMIYPRLRLRHPIFLHLRFHVLLVLPLLMSPLVPDLPPQFIAPER